MLKSVMIPSFIAVLILAGTPALSQTAADYANLKSKIDNLEQQLQALKTALPQGPPTDPTPGNQVGGGDSQAPTQCPKGQYAVGVRWWGAPGSTRYCIGCLSGIQILCQKFNIPASAAN
jgi:hypothetical protein